MRTDSRQTTHTSVLIIYLRTLLLIVYLLRIGLAYIVSLIASSPLSRSYTYRLSTLTSYNSHALGPRARDAAQ
ncbi:hypothetical protein J3R30DRAFT_8302 [Lentinula aciculospora]|uniref:Uncharacterized protein n=1 Tax=Lentinula aciculospora TaxID=153920 RepID=A0A9W9AT63_9AGAR|nr:hypothetical protein J3R30DRAFT_8302 [Lentinula aciculospora]